MEWKDITIQKFISINEILKSEQDELSKKIQIYNLLTGVPMEEIREMPLGVFFEKYNSDFAFLLTEIPQVVPKYWEYNNVRYHITTEVEKLKAGQYIDFKEYSKEPEKIHNIMAVLCYADGKYNGETHKERAEMFYKYMPITVVAPLAVFFLNLWQQWSEISLSYSRRMMAEVAVDLQETTAG